MKKDTKEISAIVTDVFFYKPTDTNEFKLYLQLQMFDGLIKSLTVNLDFIPVLLNKVCSYDDAQEYYFDLKHMRLRCLCRKNYRDTPLGRMDAGYSIVAIRDNIHREWLYVE